MTIQDLNKKMTDTHRYLNVRCCIYFLMAFLSIESLYNMKNITYQLFFSNMLLFTAPLYIEYKYSIKSNTKISNVIRWIAYSITGVVCIVCFMGIFTISEIKLNDTTSYIEGIYLYKENLNIIYLIRYVHFILAGITFIDCFLVWQKDELKYYYLLESTEEHIEQEMDKISKEDVLENARNKKLQEYKSKIANATK